MKLFLAIALSLIAVVSLCYLLYIGMGHDDAEPGQLSLSPSSQESQHHGHSISITAEPTETSSVVR